MNLFISNFKFKQIPVILKVTLLCLILFLTYNQLIKIHPPKISLFDSQFKYNVAVAQRCIYDYAEIPVVIVGSSLAASLDNDILLENKIFNLSLKGSGAITGLNLITMSRAQPKIVLIEINSILSGKNYELIDKLMSPISYKLKRYFPSLREEYQPVNVFINMLITLSDNPPALVVYDKKRFDKVFEIKKRKFATPPNPQLLLERINGLDILVDELTDSGVTPVFFEMPIHEELEFSPMMVTLRNSLMHRFPKGRYAWMEGTSISDLQTSDGVHLTSESALRISKELTEKLKYPFDFMK